MIGKTLAQAADSSAQITCLLYRLGALLSTRPR